MPRGLPSPAMNRRNELSGPTRRRRRRSCRSSPRRRPLPRVGAAPNLLRLLLARARRQGGVSGCGYRVSNGPPSPAASADTWRTLSCGHAGMFAQPFSRASLRRHARASPDPSSSARRPLPRTPSRRRPANPRPCRSRPGSGRCQSLSARSPPGSLVRVGDLRPPVRPLPRPPLGQAHTAGFVRQ
jgi:hypothetical protein